MIGENHGLRLWQELVIGLCAAVAMGVLWRLAAFVVESRGRGGSV